MNWASECAVVIPCLNEAAAIGSLVAAVRQRLPAVIVVDDGSADRTSELAAGAGAEVIRHATPLGKGTALMTGWARARERGFRWVLSMDGDGQHDVGDIPALLACAERTGARLVVGDRMARPAGMPWVRRLVNWWMSRRISRLLGCHLPDTQNGYRLMELESWAGLRLEADHFEIESELLCRFVLAAHRVEFVPVQVIYGSERSKIRPWRDARRWIRWWWRARAWCRAHQPAGGT
jgi:glycosyltransferase involved in cell wall biosynthesis